jgi:hypothetical protein
VTRSRPRRCYGSLPSSTGSPAFAHRDDRVFGPLAACQSRAADARIALAATGTPHPTAIAPFEALLALIDTHKDVDRERWGALNDTVATAFGNALAVAATSASWSLDSRLGREARGLRFTVREATLGERLRIVAAQPWWVLFDATPETGANILGQQTARRHAAIPVY